MEMNLKRFYVYYHKVKGEIIYVGMGKSGRTWQGYFRSEKWKKIVDEAGNFEPIIVKWFDDQKEARNFEEKEIRRLRPAGNSIHNTDWRKTVPVRVYRQDRDFLKRLASDKNTTLTEIIAELLHEKEA